MVWKQSTWKDYVRRAEVKGMIGLMIVVYAGGDSDLQLREIQL